jgi:hypothetical protein
MKDLIKKILKEETEPVLMIPGARYFGGVDGLRTYIEKSNIKRWSLSDSLNLHHYEGDLTWLEGIVSTSGSLNLEGTQIESLGNLQSVGGYLDLKGTQIKFLGNLKSVGGYLDLRETQIKSFGNLQSVGFLYLNEFLSEKYTDEEIRSMINVGGIIYRE